jgi:coatomer subunit alpha
LRIYKRRASQRCVFTSHFEPDRQPGALQIALHFVQDKNTRFELALECGNLDVALETARTVDKAELWNRLAHQALAQGNHKVRPDSSCDFATSCSIALGGGDRVSKDQELR